MRIARLIAGYAAILFMLPYLALKVAWLSGNPIGFNDPVLVDQPGMMAANAISFGMDVVAVGLALTFAHRWGQRVWAGLVLFPMWAATGFLLPAVAVVPIAVILRALAAEPAPHTNAMLEPWVGRVIGASFAGQGAALIAAFVLYVRARWADRWRSRPAEPAREPRHPVPVVLASLTAVMAVSAGALHLVWAFGGTVGLGPRALAERTASFYLLNGTWGLMSLAGAAGVLAMVRQGRRSPFGLVALTWIGSGSMFAWGLWTLTLVLAGITLRPGEPLGALPSGLSLVKFTAGLLMGLAAVLLLAKEARRDPPRAS